MYIEDTIAAISTPPGTGGIAIIRVSGLEAIHIADKIFKGIKGKKLHGVGSHTIHYGHIYKPQEDKIIDEVLVSVMRAPHTFTKENIVEINCHGGIVSTRKVLEQVIEAGARLADPGEFTKRAFLNGRIDLVQAEAIIDIINSKTDYGMENAVEQLEGSLSWRIKEIRGELLQLAAHLQAAVDFPEEDIEEISEENLSESLKALLEKTDFLLKTADQGKIIREGLSTVIIGKPNVGKSSFLNAMVREKRAIVTEIPGTTRDIIEEFVNIKGVPLRIIDTAGIRETSDTVEKIGVDRAKEIIEKADLIILMLDSSESLTDNDLDIIELVKSKKVITLLNKSDIEKKIDIDDVKRRLADHPMISVSVKHGEGLDHVEETIHDLFFAGDISIKDDIIITNVRHKDSLIKAKRSLMEALEALNNNMPVDMVTIDIDRSIEAFGEIVGMTVSEEIIDQIFREFCLGK